MFAANYIWKRGLWRSLLAVVFGITITLLTAPAAGAAGETYTWQDADDTSVLAVGGNFGVGNQVTFAKAADTNGSPTFTANATYTCGSENRTGPLTLTIDSNSYKTAYPTTGTISGADSACGFTQPSIFKAGANPTTGQPSDTTDNQRPNCDQGGFTWLLCPVIDNLSSAISNLAKDVLEPLLQVKPISADNTPELYKTWTHIRDFTEVLFILVFIIIIIATVMQDDIPFFSQYTIKRTLPRLVIASVLVQFSFLMSGLLVDIGNVLGGGIGNLLVAITDPSKGPASFSNLVGNLVTDSVLAVTSLGALAVLASWTVALPILASLFLSLLVVFLTLGARYLLISVLVVLSPLAMLAWVLPNTEKQLGDWFKFFFRLILMYPLVIGIITFAGIVSQILPFSGETAPSGGAAVAAALIRPLIVIAAFAIIPVSFRLAGRVLHRAYGFLSGAAQKAKSGLKGTDMWERGQTKRKERQTTFMNSVFGSKAITSLEGKGKLGKGTANVLTRSASIGLMGAPATRQALASNKSKLANKNKKLLEELDEATVPAMQKTLQAYSHANPNERKKLKRQLQNDAPNLLKLADTLPGRLAIVKQLANMDSVGANTIQDFAYAPKSRNIFSTSRNVSGEYRDLATQAGKEFSKKPVVLARVLKDDPNYKVKDAAGQVVMERVNGELVEMVRPRTVGSLDMNTAGLMIRKISGTSFGDKHTGENFKVMGNIKNDNPKLREAARDAATAYAINLDPKVLQTVFNPTTREFKSTPLDVRLEWAKNVALNGETFNNYKPELLEHTAAHLHQDTELTNALVKLAAQAGGLSNQEVAERMEVWGGDVRARIAKRYIYGQNYNAATDYTTDWDPAAGGGTTPPGGTPTPGTP